MLQVSVASLNIACARRDEATNPLFARLPVLVQFLQKQKTDHNFSILCIQEIRPTGNMTPLEVILVIQKALGKEWEFSDQTVNPSQNAFHRTIFWDTTQWKQYCNDVVYTANAREPHFPFMFTETYFCEAESKTNQPLFNVINAHAPMSKLDRVNYWNRLISASLGDKTPAIIIGDLNKFSEDHKEYRETLARKESLVDLVGLQQETFVSFPVDLDPQGNLWRSCLDAIIVDSHEFKGQVTVVSTEPVPRPTDHFFIVGHLQNIVPSNYE